MVKTTFSGTISQIQEASVDGRDVVGLAIATNAETILQFVWHSSVQATPIPSGTSISIEYVPVEFHIPESQKRIELARSEQVVRRCKATVTNHEQIRTGLPGAADIGLDRDIVTIEFRTIRETCLFDRIPGYTLQTGCVVELDLALTGISIPEQQMASKWEEKVQKTARKIHTQDTQSASEPKAYAASSRRFIRGVAASQALPDEWMPHRKRNEIADGFKKEFFNLCERARLVQEHGMVSSFKFIQGSDLIKYRRFPHYNEAKHLLKRFDEIKSAKHFISHRWFCPTHPDPDGRQLALLRPYLEAKAFYWVDFTCLPQKSRTQEEEAVFRDSITWLPSLMFDMSFIALRFEDDGYVERAWCFFELLAATVLSRQIRYVADQTAARGTDQIELHILESTLLEGRLPHGLGITDSADQAAIEEAAETVTAFFKLRLVEHYMGLGQVISGQDFFFGEDPYYLMATCNFSPVMVWAFKKAREHQMTLVELGHDYRDSNFFVKMAEKEMFRHTTNPYSFSRRITRDEARLGWLIINKHRPDSASNLFYILSSIIE